MDVLKLKYRIVMVLKNCFPINFIMKYIEFDYINLYLCIEPVKLFLLKTRLNHFGKKKKC